ncbi:antirepressor [Bacillus pseudomycoides]|uniref:phage repressor protein/antirepressor Ant n=2 Tax=Bacillus TaxID=1386 RepID=UPI0001A153CB|nr:phage repressor protein/antirepressor Ant [Bacillus pseudomycoides]EEM17491.1 Prophage antirepressor [Bacillus pseudomycoides DSM 12442]MBD5795510.1 antirepressor [Bacillus pseudomycoides]OOR53984.1 phage repressor protein/antirepressor Ant [Bacillus pseudomycoides]PDY13043.1 phage repressor protein/antirepressor Ant [Bacillus pseudomycoides]PEB41416.1 phage repressor protein/antirepressor Ant [Bacillus pseudomycoides]
MMNNLLVFDHEELGQVRSIKQGEEIYFVAKDVSDILEFRDAYTATRGLDDDEKLLHTIYVAGQNREVTLINESGLYGLILTSRKPQAKAFKKWITSEVLPSIRKDGGYLVTTEEDDEQAIMAKALLLAQRTLERKNVQLKQAEETIKIQVPKVEYTDKVLSTEGYYTATEVAKIFGMRSPQGLYNKLVDKKIIYKSRKKNYLHKAEYSFLRDENYIRYQTTAFGLQMLFSELGRYWIAQQLGIITQ